MGTGIFSLLVGPAGHLVRAVEAVKKGSLIETLGQFVTVVFVPLPLALEVRQGGQQVTLLVVAPLMGEDEVVAQVAPPQPYR